MVADKIREERAWRRTLALCPQAKGVGNLPDGQAIRKGMSPELPGLELETPIPIHAWPQG